jgi:hypothetical protein
MISPDSVLYRLPPGHHPKQVLFFDGIRHVAEILGIAYPRLQGTLTEMALQEIRSESLTRYSASAFLDAWAIVDAIDRFRILWKLVPGKNELPLKKGETTFQEVSEPIRRLRNVADHLGQRADYMVARQGTALGELSWCTRLNLDCTNGICCLLIPGTFIEGDRHGVLPNGSKWEGLTGLIHLTAGDHKANLSSIISDIGFRLKQFEESLEQSFKKAGINGQRAGADMLIKFQYNQ